MNHDFGTTHASIFPRLSGPESGPRNLAWAEFYIRYGPAIAGFARRLGANHQDAENVVQEVMTGFFSALPGFVYNPAKGRFRSYLKRAALHALRRQRGRQPFMSLVSPGPAAPSELETIWEAEWEHHLMVRALEAVRRDAGASAAFRAFELHVLLGRPAARVATELGLAGPNSVYQAKKRTIEALRRALEALRADDP